jgi:hypothetical protein
VAQAGGVQQDIDANGGEEEEDVDDDVQIHVALAHVLGFYRKGWELVPLVNVTTITMDDMDLPTSLTPSMIPGAVIDRDRVNDAAIAAGYGAAGAVRKGGLIYFLKTRDFHGLSTLTWASAAKAVQQQLQLEEHLAGKAEEDGEAFRYVKNRRDDMRR